MDEIDCSFVDGNKWFRFKALGILIDNGKVLAVQNSRDPYYYPLGGGIRHGETAEEAVVREVFEETGIRLEADHLAFVHENLFIGNKNSILEGLSCHEVAFYFLMKWIPGSQIIENSKTYDEIPEHLIWLEISELNKLDRPFYPEFFADELPQLSERIKHVVTISDNFKDL